MPVPRATCGSEGVRSPAASRASIAALAISKASLKSSVALSASTSQARPKKVATESLPQPNEVRSRRAAVITSVSGATSSSTRPPE